MIRVNNGPTWMLMFSVGVEIVPGPYVTGKAEAIQQLPDAVS
jgi:hypothetical protein